VKKKDGRCEMIVKQKSKKRGSVTISLLVYIMATVLVVGYFAEAAAGLASRSYANSVIDLAGRSVLSEFDRHLLRDYGLMGMLLDSEMAEDRLKFYICNSFISQPGKLDFFRLNLTELQADTGAYSLTEPKRLHEQIVAYMKPRAAVEGVSALSLLTGNRLLVSAPTSNQSVGAKETADVTKERRLGNRQIVEALPSQNIAGISGLGGSLPTSLNPSDLAKSTGRDLLLNLYILSQFRNHMSADFPKTTFFRNEVEYVLAGQTNDKTNRILVLTSLLAVRSAINLTHIYQDPAKRQAVMTMALSLATATGPAVAVIFAMLATIWAAFEGLSDIRRLLRDDGVPLIKTAADWRTDLRYAIDHQADLLCPFERAQNFAGQSQNGQSAQTACNLSDPHYQDYLLLLLCFKSANCKLFRVMDLIQLDMKGRYYKEFLMKRCYAGVDFNCRIQRQSGYFLFSGKRMGEFASCHEY
jgi:hypothetical protein